jgi:two-component system sensor histidine kinase KdpD
MELLEPGRQTEVCRTFQLPYNETVANNLVNSSWAGYLGAVLGSAFVTASLAPFYDHINSTTVALAFLLVVLFVALFWGSKPALLASVLGMLCLNFFFLPPFYTLSITHSDNWVALAAFFTTALAVGQLSARARQRAEEAETGKREIERLYQELRDAFERASHAEALRQSERLKSALLDAVTHDLRTPLTSIKASITTLLDEVRSRPQDEQLVALDSESRLEMMEVIDEESDRLNRFIGGLIELARIEAGELRLRRRWGTVDEMISTALARAETFTQGRDVEMNIEPDLPVVRVDERAVSEVIYTLVDNAAKYSPRGSSIRITASLAGDGMIEMAVEDSGAGVPADLRERVFDKFFRATRDGDISTHQPSGTGMGLAIAKGIVEAHNGKIWIEPGSGGVGTRVAFTVPIGDEETTEQPSVAEPIESEIDER